jgi:preprotein translocase subunit SecG
MEFLFYTLFFLSSLLLVLVILLQEGKGGGLSDAFGGAGAETFGVRSGGINRFTFGVFGVFVLSAMMLHWMAGDPLKGSVMQNVAGVENPEILPVGGGTGSAPPPAGGSGGPIPPSGN